MSRMRDYFDLEPRRQKVEEIERRLSEPGAWDRPEEARSLIQEMNLHKQAIESWQSLEDKSQELEVFLEVAREDDPGEMDEVARTCESLRLDLERIETDSLLSGEHDRCSAILSVHAGAGGVDAQDWADMLLRMYMRWAQKEGYKVELADRSEGEEAGIHSGTVFVTGTRAYGMLQSERGVHRLVRISPFDQAKRRHTAFARVEVMPEIENDVEVEIRPEEVRVDTFRSSGAGGQHVNKTDSAIRLTHMPTGIVVSCQNERSQHSNRATAFRILKARLFELQQLEQEERLRAIKGEHREAAWANQIRSYVLQPYTQVKDRRTGVETSGVQAVLDGDLNAFMRGYLEARKRLGREPTPSDGGVGDEE
ncbi:MAG: peptide chain release factor 2 [Candidatus Eremiobacterota bacterium]